MQRSRTSSHCTYDGRTGWNRGRDFAQGPGGTARGTDYSFFLLHDPACVSNSASLLRLELPIKVIRHPKDARAVFAHALPVFLISLPARVNAGEPGALNALSAIDSIRTGAEFAKSGEVSALVTNPIQKSTVYAAGFAFPGHTEFLEHLAGEPFRATMMPACPALKGFPSPSTNPLNRRSQP